MAQQNNFPAIRKQLTAPNVMEMVKNRIGEKSSTFVSSVLDLIGGDNTLMMCDPNLVMKEALKAAALDLPVSKTLGFAYVIPYKDRNRGGAQIPQFQIGYKGIIQLAIRTGQFRHLNAGVVYEGEEIVEDRIRGTVELKGNKKSDKPVAYFAYMQLTNGFEKAIVWSRDTVDAHAKRYSKGINRSSSPWKTNFDEMAKKTMVLRLKSYMPMSIEMSTAMQNEIPEEPQGFDREVATEISANANSEVFEGEIVGQGEPMGQTQNNQAPTEQEPMEGYGPGMQEPEF